MQEIWKDIQGYEGFYQVSNIGRVRSVDRVDNRGHKRKGKILNVVIDNHGYQAVHLCLYGISKYHKVHRLVAVAFVINPKNFQQINHKDENKLNNCAENLEWCTARYNINYGERNKLVGMALAGEKSYNHKLTNEEVEEIRKIYKPRSKDFNLQKLSKKYGVSLPHISRIVNNKRWKENKEV